MMYSKGREGKGLDPVSQLSRCLTADKGWDQIKCRRGREERKEWLGRLDALYTILWC